MDSTIISMYGLGSPYILMYAYYNYMGGCDRRVARTMEPK